MSSNSVQFPSVGSAALLAALPVGLGAGVIVCPAKRYINPINFQFHQTLRHELRDKIREERLRESYRNNQLRLEHLTLSSPTSTICCRTVRCPKIIRQNGTRSTKTLLWIWGDDDDVNNNVQRRLRSASYRPWFRLVALTALCKPLLSFASHIFSAENNLRLSNARCC